MPHSPDPLDGGDVTADNIAAVLSFHAQEDLGISRAQWFTEQISHFVVQPMFVVVVLAFVAAWMAINVALRYLHLAAFDVAPFPWLQGVVALNALLVSTVVMVRQNRLAKLAGQRADLDLKVMLLIEHKTAKLIDLIEELRRDLPDVRDRHDPGAVALRKAMSPDLVKAALDMRKGAETGGPQEEAGPPSEVPGAGS